MTARLFRWALIAAGVLAWAPAAEAQTKPTCSFDGTAAAVTVNVNGRIARLQAHKPSGEIRLNGVVCGAARLTNTDSILVVGGPLDDTLKLIGTFAPGLTAEGDGSSEIEVSVAFTDADLVRFDLTGGSNRLIFTGGGIDVGEDGDEDVTTAGTGHLEVWGLGGNDVIDASAYSAMPSAGQLFVALYGGEGDDWLIGTNVGSEDVLDGQGGDDALYGRGGVDILRGGPGNDILYGGQGNDTFISEILVDGGDEMHGGPDLDYVSYQTRPSTMPVTVTVGNGLADDGAPGEGDLVDGNIEIIVGTSGPDVLIGSEGPEQLDGRDGDDQLVGGSGDDLLLGGNDNDTLDGGDGADLLDGGNDHDTVTYDTRTAAITVTLDSGGANDGEDGEGDEVVSVEDVVGSQGPNVLVGNNKSNRFWGSDTADDELYGGGAADVLRGLGGDDLLVGDSGDDILDGGEDDDTLDGGTGNDTLDGRNGADFYDGGDGNDIMRNGDGFAETVDCGAGTADNAEFDGLDTLIGCEL